MSTELSIIKVDGLSQRKIGIERVGKSQLKLKMALNFQDVSFYNMQR